MRCMHSSKNEVEVHNDVIKMKWLTDGVTEGKMRSHLSSLLVDFAQVLFEDTRFISLQCCMSCQICFKATRDVTRLTLWATPNCPNMLLNGLSWKFCTDIQGSQRMDPNETGRPLTSMSVYRLFFDETFIFRALLPPGGLYNVAPALISVCVTNRSLWS